MQAHPFAALSYAPPAELAARYDLDDERAAKPSGLEAVTDAATAP